MNVKDRLYQTLDLGASMLMRDLRRELAGIETVLDLGCGPASPLRYLPRPKHSVGVEAHPPALEASRAAGIHDEYFDYDVRELPFEAGSFDAVMMIDLLEHLSPEDGGRLLDRVSEIARKRVLVFTPNGFVPQDEYGDNPLQKHLSGWTAEELRSRGFEVHGMGGHRALRGELARYRRPFVLTAPLASLSQLGVYNRPSKAFHLLAVKRLG